MNGVHFVAGTPNAYIHQPGMLETSGEWIAKYGKRLFIVTGTKSWASAGDALTRSLKAAGVEFEVVRYRGECSIAEVERLRALVRPEVDLIAGVGAGKAIDTAKKLAIDTGRPLIAVPTLAATCAAVSNLSVMYTDEGVYTHYTVYDRNTQLVLVDTDVIAAAPVRYLVAGIGDTLAKWIEALASSTGKPHNLPTLGGLQAAKLCYDTLLDHSQTAIEDAKAGRSSEALQKVIDANILMSGMVGGLGEDNCRTAAAHAVHNGLTAIPELHEAFHGEKVAYGILVQMAMEKRPREEMDELLGFYKRIGLPCKLEELGLKRPLTPGERQKVALASLSPDGTMGNMPFPVTVETVLEAIDEVERHPVSAK